MTSLNQKKRIISKILKPKHKKAFKFIWTFNRFFIKFKSYNFFSKINRTVFIKKNIFLMFYYFYNLKINLKSYYKKNIKFLNNNFLHMLQCLDLRTDVVLLKMTFFSHIGKAQLLIKKGFVFVNNYKQFLSKICKISDIIWINTLSNFQNSIWKRFFFNEKLIYKRKKGYWSLLALKKNQLKYNVYLEIDFKIKQLIILSNPKINTSINNSIIPINSIRTYSNIALKQEIKHIYLSY